FPRSDPLTSARSRPPLATKTRVKPPSGAEIRARRKELGMTQQDLAEKADLDGRAVPAYEKDSPRPRAKTRKRLIAPPGGTLLPVGTGGGGASEAPGVTGISADQENRSVPQGEIIVARDAEMIVVWKGKDGGLSAIAAGFDKRLVATPTRAEGASVED